MLGKQVLIEDGIAGVKVERLAAKAGVTRGGFYHRFKSLDLLLEAMVEHWRATNHQPIIDALTKSASPTERIRSLIRLWLDERDYDPDYDTAIRAWSRVSPKIAAVVRRIDRERIKALKQVFLEAGCDEDEALVRAEISYFHQVGYYAMGVRESQRQREELSGLYFRVLTGFEREGGNLLRHM